MRSVWVGLVLLLAPSMGAAQGPSFTWRASGGVGYGTVATAGPHQDDGQTPTVFRVSIERAVGSRFAVGADWIGSWYEGALGDERRHALTVTGSAYVVGGLHVRGGVGPGVASWVEVDGPPVARPGDVLISISEGDPSLAFTAGWGYDVPIGAFQLTPDVTYVGHRLHGATLSLWSVGARVWLRTPE